MGLQYSIACPSDVERQGLLPSQFFLGSASHIPGQASGPPVFGQYTQKKENSVFMFSWSFCFTLTSYCCTELLLVLDFIFVLLSGIF